MSAIYLPVKRLMDVVVATGGLIASAPLMILCGLAVKFTSAGPILFRQMRVGQNGRQFQLLKFRSMRVQNRGPFVTSAGDPRVTRIGRLLRRSKLDELPQLFNVLKGDMSLVGPRPEVPRYVGMFADQYERILRIRPGITDLASIQFRHEEAILAKAQDSERAYVEVVLPEKLRLNEAYLVEMSLWGDLLILFRTIMVIFK